MTALARHLSTESTAGAMPRRESRGYLHIPQRAGSGGVGGQMPGNCRQKDEKR